MKHTIDELLEIVYAHYPRENGPSEVLGVHDKTGLQARLVDARCKAATDNRWHNLLERMSERFPGMIANQSLHLPTGHLDACFLFTLSFANSPDHRKLWFGVSFLAPYYTIWCTHLVDVVKEIEGLVIPFHGISFYITRQAIGTEFLSGLDDETRKGAIAKEEDILFDFSTDEQHCANWIVHEIESTFECERLPHDVGMTVIPDVKTNHRALGEARLLDCLFTDEHAWVKPLTSDKKTRLPIGAERLPDNILRSLTVLAALHHLAIKLAGMNIENMFYAVSTDGVLRKIELKQLLARVHTLDKSLASPDTIAAMREFEELTDAWNDDDSAFHELITWATSYLAKAFDDNAT